MAQMAEPAGDTVALRADLNELRDSVFRHTLYAVAGICVLLILVLAITYQGSYDRSEADYADYALAAIGVLGVTVWVSLLVRRVAGVSAASVVLIGGMGSILVVAITAVDPCLACWFSLLVILAGSLLGTLGAIAVGTGACSILAAFAVNGTIATDVAVIAGLLVVMMALASWLSIRPTYTAIQWAWSSYLQSRRTTEELRSRQAELVRTGELLRRTNERLQRLNRDLERAREAAEEARQVKAQFAANVSHELRTPIHHIVGFASMMINRPRAYGAALPPSYRDDLEAIYRSAQHLAKLIDDVLDLSQIEAGRMGLVKEKSDLGQIVQEAVAVVSGTLRGKGLELRVKLATDIPQVYVDRTRIRQVIINLLSNAGRFTELGCVTVEARLEGADAQVSVSDTGIGIARTDLPKVFEEFRQLDGSAARRQGGTGLGLAICKRFVDLHGGQIWAASEPGHGSTFTFSIPLEAKETPHPIPAATSSRGRTVAAGRDEPRTLAVLARDPALGRLVQRFVDGFQVVSVADEQVLSQNDALPADAVLVTADSLPEALGQLRTLQDRSDGALLAACHLREQRRNANMFGFAGRLVKPLSVADLQAQMEQLGGVVRRVTVVSADDYTNRFLVRLLRALPTVCRAQVATTCEQAFALMSKRLPDAVLLDVTTVPEGGRALLAQMRASPSLCRVPLIAIAERDVSEEALVTDGLFLTRGRGLTVSQLISCLSTGFSALSTSPGSVPAPSGAPPE